MNKRGVTLIELIVAATLCLIMIFAFSYLLRTAKTSLTSVEKISGAAIEIHNVMEQLQTLPFEQLAGQNNKTFSNGQGKIKISTILSDLTKIEVQHKWHAHKSPLYLTTLRSLY